VVASDETLLRVCLKSTPVRQPSGSLLGIGRRNAMMHSTEVKADDGTVFRRNANGVYFQVDQAWTSFDGSPGLEVGDEVLAIDSYKMVDMSLDTARYIAPYVRFYSMAKVYTQPNHLYIQPWTVASQ